VTLNRPALNNAYNADLLEGLIETCAALAADPRVRVVVVRGNGAHFQAGADLKWLRPGGRDGRRHQPRRFDRHRRSDARPQ
jgi:methylglutaconyl-CoA hydratase